MDNEQVLNHARVVRGFTSRVTHGLSEKKLLQIPSGSRNNILWNVGHVITDQCNMLYTPSGLALPLPDAYPGWFDPGTSPADWRGDPPNAAGVIQTVENLVGVVEEDYRSGKFSRFKPYAPNESLTLNSIDEAINYCTIHEAIHLGIILTLRKLVAPKG